MRQDWAWDFLQIEIYFWKLIKTFRHIQLRNLHFEIENIILGSKLQYNFWTFRVNVDETIAIIEKFLTLLNFCLQNSHSVYTFPGWHLKQKKNQFEFAC